MPLLQQHLEKPDPEIYRLAADLIREGKEDYACLAISEVCCSLYPEEGFLNALKLSKLYIGQYEALFSSSVLPSHLFSNSPVYLNSYEFGIYKNKLWWDKKPTDERQELREMSLLLMADIVEQGN